KNGKQDVYLREAGYNLYGQTVYRHLGNGSKELFTFDENNRLETSTLELQGQTISTNTYRYDKADNITDIMQTAGAGGYLQHYEYDGLNRLVKATGRDNTPYGDAQYSHYTMEMAYNAMSSPVKIEKNLNGTFIRNEYLYGLEEHPNAPQQVGDRRYTYSASGNPLTIEGGDVNRTLTWDAENRLRRIYDSRSGQLHLYTYNHLGERALKRYGKAQAMAVNDKDAGALLDTKDNYSAYVSPYFVGHNGRYTKHYYAGAMRIASKMGASGSTYAAGTDEPDLYFYHTDHLGSTTYITDRKEVAQYVAYTPYGETFKEYKNVTPYKFNGKELDQETGYYYYGARYYDPSTALWFGTDPLQHKYPEVSPYVYCAGNPVVRIDPDGRWVQIVIGAAVGAVVNGTVAAIEGKSGKQIAAAAIGGAVGGAIASANPDLIVEYGAMAGAAGDIAEQCINIALGEADEYDVGSTVISAGTGLVFNAFGTANTLSNHKINDLRDE
ncbi:MAG: hypothetical protein IKS58_02105, partial [Paludibacteraceae bacterium]|nr:hypothetical protein [Paludibacteraceae bacterium]